jgi:hypothetical protein
MTPCKLEHMSFSGEDEGEALRTVMDCFMDYFMAP